VAVSIGAVLSSHAYHGADDLLRDAEIAMYRAKANGKARCEVFDSCMHSSAVRRLKLETDLRRALEQGELIVYYQPIVSLKTGKIVGFEALSRWKSPEGIVSPAEFIPVADETGLIVPINRRVYIEACQQIRSWQAQFVSDPPLMISLNVSAIQFAQPELVDEIHSVLRKTGVPPSTVHLEILENIAMDDPRYALSTLDKLRTLGVHLSIDDFGTGYSSLSRLPKFPITALKIDRAFVSDMNVNRESYEIVRLIVMLAHSLGLKVVAEGTEQIEQINRLQKIGCDMAQGYAFSPPVDHDSAGRLLAQETFFKHTGAATAAWPGRL
jgi:EAL domain-containing protein (putative c-di-GMP-specific phosphodiesterase class I)